MSTMRYGITHLEYIVYKFPVRLCCTNQSSVLGCPKPVLGRTVPKTRFKPAFYCPKLSKTAQNRLKLSETANWLRKCHIDTWIDIKFAKFKLSNA